MSNKNDYPELEDGEIDFDASLDDIYTPLERPVRNDTVPPPEVIESDVDESDNSKSDSDSSQDGGNEPKTKKSKLTKSKSQNPNKNKLKIWCNVLEDENVANNLTDCNLDESQMRIRGLVPYPKRFHSNDSYKGNPGTSSGKRNHAGQFVNDRKHGKDNNSNSKAGVPKPIPPLSENVMDSDASVAKEIANNLNEVKYDLILRAVEIAGKERIISIFEETRQMEMSGGMLVMNESRRRTSGGVFFYLLKSNMDIPQEQLREIFLVDKQNAAALKKKTAKQSKTLMNPTETNKAGASGKFM